MDKKDVKDFGCDPLENGKYKMVPSGEIVNEKEMLSRRKRDMDNIDDTNDMIFGKTWEEIQDLQQKR